MKDLLQIVTDCIDAYCEQENLTRRAVIIGGEAVILHGIPRTTFDVDLLVYLEDEGGKRWHQPEDLGDFIAKKMGDDFHVVVRQATKDPTDPLRHDILIVTDTQKQFKKLDILLVNFAWEIDGLRQTERSDAGSLRPLAKPYLVALKLMAGGPQDEHDILGLFYLMSESEKEEARALAKSIGEGMRLEGLLAE